MKKCPYCSAEIQDDSKYCNNCLKWLNSWEKTDVVIEWNDNVSDKLIVDKEIFSVVENNDIKQDKTKLVGIRWWLILPFISLFFYALSLTNLIYTIFQVYNNIDSTTYKYVVDMEILLNLSEFIFILYVIYLFIRKDKLLPKMYMILLVIFLLIPIIDEVMVVTMLKDIVDTSKIHIWFQSFRSLLPAIVWISYFKTSVRVKNTFVN